MCKPDLYSTIPGRRRINKLQGYTGAALQSMRSLVLITLTQDIIKERTDTIISEKRAKLARTHEQSSTKNDDPFLGPWREKDFIIK